MLIQLFNYLFYSRLSAQQIKDYNWISTNVVSSDNSIISSTSNGSTTSDSTNTNSSTSKTHTQTKDKVDFNIHNNDDVSDTFER